MIFFDFFLSFFAFLAFLAFSALALPRERLELKREDGEARVGSALERALTYLQEIVRYLPPRVIHLWRDERPPILVWSDAMYEAGADRPAMGGFVVLVPAEGEEPERVYWASEATHKRVFGLFMKYRRVQYIGELELLYAVAPYTSLPKVLAGRRVIHFIDNTSACSALVKGYARILTSGRIVNAFHATNVGLQADVYFEYVRSAANIADMPSRDAIGEMLAALADVAPEAEVHEVKCVVPKVDSWLGSAVDWIMRAKQALCARQKRPREE